MRSVARIKVTGVELKAGFLTFLRGILSVVEASRLDQAFAYGLAVIFVLMPVGFIGMLLNWALARKNVWVGPTVVSVAAVFLLVCAALMSNENFLRDIRLQGIKWPSLLSVALAWLAVVVFGGMSCGFERMGIVEIHPKVPFGDGCATRYADMYLWHLFDSIPGIKFNETIGWTQRYTYHDALSGWLLLSFKALVLISVIGSFVVCGRLRREALSAADPSGQPEKKDAARGGSGSIDGTGVGSTA